MTDPRGQDSVLGHYSVLGNSLQPLLAESSSLFKAVVEDDAAHVAALGPALDVEATRLHNVLHWTSAEEQPGSNGGGESEQPVTKASRPIVSVKNRTLLMLSAYHAASTGKLQVLKLLLSVKAADPKQLAPDGTSSISMALSANGDSEQEVLALLNAASDSLQPQAAAQHSRESLTNSASSGRLGQNNLGQAPGAGTGADHLNSNFSEGTLGAPSSASDHGSTATVAAGFPISVDLQHHLSLHQQEGEADLYNSEGLPYSTSELTQPEYSTDDFRMFAFKVLRCSKRFAHDWRACPFSHPTENARRRDPREFRYCAIACPDYKQGFCVRGDMCPYAHGVFEAWLHPSRYRTQLCKDGANCHRPICFFAHSLPELRTPTHTWTPGAEDAAAAAAAQHMGPGGVDHSGQPGGRQGGGKAGPRQQGMGGYQSQHHGNGRGAGEGNGGMHHAHPHHGGKGNGMAGAGAMSYGADTPGGPHAPPMTPKVMADASIAASGAVTPGAVLSTGPGTATASPSSGSVAAAMFGFTAPRMSNAFARRHGLNPKDNAMLNLQKIALQAQPGSAAGEHLGRLFHNSPGQSGGGHPGMNGGMGGHHGMGGQPGEYMQQPPGGGYGGRGMGMGMGMGQHMMMQQGGGGGVRGKGGGGYGSGGQGMGQGGGNPLMMQHGYGYPAHNGLMAMQSVAAAASHDPSALAALNHHLASLNIHPTAAAAAAAYAAGQASAGMGLGFNGMGNAGSYNHHDGTMASTR